jgi:hypothetical protein
MGTKAIYNLFKFIEDKKPQYKPPFKVKLIHAPETLTKEDLNVKGDLDLNDTPIQSLPNDLEVEGNLWLISSQIQSLPDNLRVGGDLYLGNTPIQSLPNGLKVGGDLLLYETPLSKKYTTKKQLKAEYPNIKVKGDIYLK